MFAVSYQKEGTGVTQKKSESTAENGRPGENSFV